jgi:hypothetical protein
MVAVHCRPLISLDVHDRFNTVTCSVLSNSDEHIGIGRSIEVEIWFPPGFCRCVMALPMSSMTRSFSDSIIWPIRFAKLPYPRSALFLAAIRRSLYDSGRGAFTLSVVRADTA